MWSEWSNPSLWLALGIGIPLLLWRVVCGEKPLV